jgi:phosphoglycerate dehydrogenase-like enzyme
VILLLESLHPEAEALLSAVGPVLRVPRPEVPASEVFPADVLAQVRAVLTRGRGRVPEALLERCPACRVIARAGAGLDNLDTAAAARRGIVVVYAPGANTSTVAEHTLALMLDLARGLTRMARAVSGGRWEERAGYRGEELRGLTLGIVGFGHIGRRVAELARAFGMQVLVAADPRRALAPEPGIAILPLEELLSSADVVSLHLPLTPATSGLIGAAELARLKPGALLINTARGALIDMPALRVALARGSLGGFAADVLEVEPPDPGDPLLASERVLLTPHLASLTGRTYRELCLYTVENVLRVLRGEAPDPPSVFGRR